MSCSGDTAGPSAAPWCGRTQSSGGRTQSPEHPWPKQWWAAGACVSPQSGQSRGKRGVFPERLCPGPKPLAGAGQSGGASGRFPGGPAVLLCGTGPSAVAAGGDFPAAAP